ncbi:MAG: tandem-95 repeat protein, partial [Alcaligenaceae bacterium]
TLEDTPVSGNVLTNDTDIDSGTLTVTQFVVGGTTYTAGQTATLAGVGTLVIGANGTYTFTPAANYNGPVPVATYTVSDGALTSTATLTLSVTPVNDAPVGVNDTATTPEDTPISGNVLTNDTDVDNANLTVTQFVVGGTTYTAGQTATLAGVGTLVINANGGYTFTPALNYNGPVPAATYTVSDGALTSTATLTVTVTPVNDAPVGVNDTATTPEDTPVTGNVLTNDTDVDNANLTVTQFVVGGTTYTAGQTATLAGVGTLVINANGSYTFTPALNYSGPVPAATYTVSDGALTSTATLTISVTPVNDPPVGVNDTATTLEDTPVSGNVLTNDTDVDSVNLTVTQFVFGGTTYTAGQTATLAG